MRNSSSIACGTCGPGAGSCAVANGTPGCDDAVCCSIVCGIDPFCCGDGGGAWDIACANQAVDHCDFTADPPVTTNAFHVVTADGVNLTVRLDGFTITEGNATGPGMIDSLGGGMLILDASPTVVRCIFTNNSAPGHGGGAIAMQDSGLSTIINCQFLDNDGAEGGAIHIETGSSAATFVNCLFARNVASGNEDNHGGAIDLGASTGEIKVINCTFTENSADEEGGAILLHLEAHMTIINCILWGNSPDEITISGGSTDLVVSYSDIEGGWGIPADMNIDDDPLFLDPFDGDYRLAFGSPCIDMGDPVETVIPQDTYDVDQDTNTTERTPDLNLLKRIVNGFVDIGAYEVEPCPWDLDGNGVVNTSDLLALFAQWGVPGGFGPADFNNDGIVNTQDLLILFANWGPCPGSGLPPPLTLEEELADACLTMDDWDEYVDVMSGSANQATKDRYKCWMEHYLNDCNKCTCLGPVPCPAPDPFDD